MPGEVREVRTEKYPRGVVNNKSLLMSLVRRFTVLSTEGVAVG